MPAAQSSWPKATASVDKGKVATVAGVGSVGKADYVRREH